MKERPILFSGQMVRAILAGTKTQTRRALKPQPPAETTRLYPYHHPDPRPHVWAMTGGQTMFDGGQLLDWAIPCPYGQPGDRLWVREAWQHGNHGVGPYDADTPVFHRADYLDDPHGPDGELSPEGKYRTWRPSIHMPRSACRLVLELTGVRVERLQSVSETDARAEGVTIAERHTMGYCAGEYLPPAIRAYRDLWTDINGAGAWDANPWVWVVEFRRVDAQQQEGESNVNR